MRVRLTFYLVLLFSSVTCAATKSKPDVASPLVGKRVVEFGPIEDVQIEMPNRSIYHFGEAYRARLTTLLLQSGRYILFDANSKNMKLNEAHSGIEWSGSVTPSAKIKVRVDALNFRSGLKGERYFYGFDERFRNPFNDGSGGVVNEFPLKADSNEPSWFGDTFDPKGYPPFDSLSGLDLGDGFNLNFLFAWLSVKYARYHAELHLNMALEAPFGFDYLTRAIQVSGDGYFYDISGGYRGFSSGIAFARSDAMNQALERVLEGSFGVIDKALKDAPLFAKVDSVFTDGTVLMGTGPSSGINKGVLYEAVNNSKITIEVDFSNESGTIGHLIKNADSLPVAGMLLKQVSTPPGPGVIPADSFRVESVTLPTQNFPAAPLNGSVPSADPLQAIRKSVTEVLTLPYRIWRYFHYDQTYHEKPDGVAPCKLDLLIDQSWPTQIGLAQAPEMGAASPVVAVIDSGVDYNHSLLHDSLWLNLFPTFNMDSRLDRYGWDFISEDSKPYDDHYHGTQVASLITTVAPHAKIMALKAFSPFGITNSASLFSSFIYAVNHGAKIIVCSWTTNVTSLALDYGIQYAKENEVIVVVAAGDKGINLDQVSVYPASFVSYHDNLVVVTGVDEKDQLFKSGKRKANFGPSQVMIAAPAQNLRVAEPRNRVSRESSTGLAAAIVAGVLARNLSARDLIGDAQDLIHELLSDADTIPGLESDVQSGYRVHVRR